MGAFQGNSGEFGGNLGESEAPSIKHQAPNFPVFSPNFPEFPTSLFFSSPEFPQIYVYPVIFRFLEILGPAHHLQGDPYPTKTHPFGFCGGGTGPSCPSPGPLSPKQTHPYAHLVQFTELGFCRVGPWLDGRTKGRVPTTRGPTSTLWPHHVVTWLREHSGCS